MSWFILVIYILVNYKPVLTTLILPPEYWSTIATSSNQFSPIPATSSNQFDLVPASIEYQVRSDLEYVLSPSRLTDFNWYLILCSTTNMVEDTIIYAVLIVVEKCSVFNIYNPSNISHCTWQLHLWCRKCAQVTRPWSRMLQCSGVDIFIYTIKLHSSVILVFCSTYGISICNSCNLDRFCVWIWWW